MKKVNVLRAITEFEQRTGSPLAKDVLFLMKMAKYVERDIQTFRSHKLGAKLVTITGAEIDEPDDMYELLKIIPGDQTGELRKYWSELSSIGINFSSTEELETLWTGMNSDQYINSKLFDLINGSIVFPDSYNGEEMTLFYTMIEKDGNGYMLVNENHIEAIVAYYKLIAVQRKNFTNFMSPKMFRANNRAYEVDVKREYFIARAKAKSEDLSLTPMEKREIDGVY